MPSYQEDVSDIRIMLNDLSTADRSYWDARLRQAMKEGPTETAKLREEMGDRGARAAMTQPPGSPQRPEKAAEVAMSPGTLKVVTMATQQAVIAYTAHKQSAAQVPASATQAASPLPGVSARGADTGESASHGDLNDKVLAQSVGGSPRLQSEWDDSSKAASQSAGKHVGGV